MDRKQKNILIWVMIWAGLLVAVLYSPVGSPDLYGPSHYYIENQGAPASNSALSNAPTISSSGGNSQGLSIPNNESSYKSGGSFSATGDAASYGVRQSYGSISGGSYSSSQSAGVSGMGSGSVGMGSVAGKSSESSSSGAQSGGFISMSSNLSGTSDNTTVKQGVGYAPGSGATDPGGDPSGSPIPVGDGYYFLILLAFVYMLWKKVF